MSTLKIELEAETQITIHCKRFPHGTALFLKRRGGITIVSNTITSSLENRTWTKKWIANLKKLRSKNERK